MTGVQTCALPICFPVTIKVFHICVKELPGVHTYKVAVTVAKALTQEIEGEQIIAVVESWKLYPNETKEKTNTINVDNKK